jgi:hypothetical protein
MELSSESGSSSESSGIPCRWRAASEMRRGEQHLRVQLLRHGKRGGRQGRKGLAQTLPVELGSRLRCLRRRKHVSVRTQAAGHSAQTAQLVADGRLR